VCMCACAVAVPRILVGCLTPRRALLGCRLPCGDGCPCCVALTTRPCTDAAHAGALALTFCVVAYKHLACREGGTVQAMDMDRTAPLSERVMKACASIAVEGVRFSSNARLHDSPHGQKSSKLVSDVAFDHAMQVHTRAPHTHTHTKPYAGGKLSPAH